MDQTGSSRPLLLRSGWPKRIAATLGLYLFGVLVFSGVSYALDPNKRITQYMHTSWRIQDGSAPAGMASVAQTSDGFLWFASAPGAIYRFDGVGFLPAQGGLINRVYSAFGDRAGGLECWYESVVGVRRDAKSG
jgi:hypothetical protein